MQSQMAGKQLKVVVIHNTYQQQGGEESVVESEIGLLRDHGHEVEVYRRHNDEIANLNKVSLALQTVWSRRTVVDINKLISKFSPDVIHVHNTHPLISPSLYWASGSEATPIVQTLHNFRIVCPEGLLLRNGRVCEDCLGHAPWRAVVHKCYRNSFLQTGVLFGALSFHRSIGTFQRKVTRYIALNEFCRKKFVEGGLPEDKISVKSNFANIADKAEKPRAGGLYVGRISNGKGIQILLSMLNRFPDINVKVIGNGPLRDVLASHPGVNYLSWQEQAQIENHMRSAEFLVLPSISYEGFPRTLVEAFACGLPVIASRLGSLMELVDDGYTGLLFEPGSDSDLAAKMVWAKSHPGEMRAMGENARREFDTKYTPEINYRQLMAIYQQAISDHSKEKIL